MTTAFKCDVCKQLQEGESVASIKLWKAGTATNELCAKCGSDLKLWIIARSDDVTIRCLKIVVCGDRCSNNANKNDVYCEEHELKFVKQMNHTSGDKTDWLTGVPPFMVFIAFFSGYLVHVWVVWLLGG